MEQPSIRAVGIEKHYRSGKQTIPILRGIDWEVAPGTIQLLMGPSGSGKTTFLTILAGLLTPDRGRVELLGQDITQLRPARLAQFRRHHIGFIFQHFNLFPALTAVENIEVVLGIKGVRGSDARQQARSLLEQVGLGSQADQRPQDLSGGQKQRVAIARALAGSPELIMADEPTAALDSQSGRRVTELLMHLARDRGCTVLIVTHDPRIVDIADRVTHLEDGALKRD
ncbi:MAG: ABC transporter ATP-binding protein [Cyanobacteria bacterium J06641_5]